MARLNTLNGRKVKGARRGGFTMIELIFVVIFLGILAAIALPKLTNSTESAALASMKSDARANITALETQYAATQSYPASQIDVDGGEKGAVIEKEDQNTGVKTKFIASPHNKVTIKKRVCDDGSAGFSVEVTSDKTDKSVTYDSCTDASIQVVDGGSNP